MLQYKKKKKLIPVEVWDSEQMSAEPAVEDVGFQLSPPVLQEQLHVPVYHPTPSQARLATQLTEEEQVRIAQRIGLIQHLPKGVYDPGRDGSEKKIRE